ncbi:hypothetical protein E0494_08665 [Marinilabiliaceae bacterium JC040]|nr:hypothetical protein [Marinilabiliaceae bacterium JC040]
MNDFEIPFELLELEDNSFHILCQIELPSGKTGNMVIDTGASKTVIDSQFVDDTVKVLENESDIKSGGLGGAISDTQIGEPEFIKIGGISFENIRLAVIDLSSINELYMQECNREIAALLGSDLLYKYNAIIDYGRKVITFKA